MAKPEKRLMPNPYAPSEPETWGQVLDNLGVPVERPNKKVVTAVKWARKNAKKRSPKGAFITFHPQRIYISAGAFEKLKPDKNRFFLGVSLYEGESVLIVVVADSGYKFTTPKNRGYKPHAACSAVGLIRQLIEAGLKPGRYMIKEVKNGWMGVPEK